MYYHITTYYDLVGTKKIPCKCPNCGNRDSLELEFFQVRTQSGFLETTTKGVTGILYCTHTKTEIPPVIWTDEIENYFNVEKKKLKLKPTKIRFKVENKKWFYTIFGILTLFILGGIAYAKYNMHQTEVLNERLENITPGDKVEVLYTLMENHSVKQSGTTWFLVKKVDGNVAWLQRNKDYVEDHNFNFDKQDTDFNGETIEVNLKQLNKRGVFGLDYTNQKFSGFITDIE
ncbi:hypothetical protein [Cellulophaga tyrosinoxydans]|uniref:Uncharacterized protein n=1 Tax=Cellulophaga tyrosinoxydans TaxID=504486 RepID=A0A1W2A7L3_9FLAO|nr:hypothetical protein [Cellulophaga tyrosinoxydans]SMC56705.1 hypothetical protein SAMN05660703_1873 [Cellulophaga tyrosinoxydans]